MPFLDGTRLYGENRQGWQVSSACKRHYTASLVNIYRGPQLLESENLGLNKGKLDCSAGPSKSAAPRSGPLLGRRGSLRFEIRTSQSMHLKILYHEIALNLLGLTEQPTPLSKAGTSPWIKMMLRPLLVRQQMSPVQYSPLPL